mmetsp:Transcript_18746/g.53852  ORF Transcript_18746/g.53852 Transcript_18746/m.53852 type:complete len:304 (+) Transcript_18746:176-1087(+)
MIRASSSSSGWWPWRATGWSRARATTCTSRAATAGSRGTTRTTASTATTSARSRSASSSRRRRTSAGRPGACSASPCARATTRSTDACAAARSRWTWISTRTSGRPRRPRAPRSSASTARSRSVGACVAISPSARRAAATGTDSRPCTGRTRTQRSVPTLATLAGSATTTRAILTPRCLEQTLRSGSTKPRVKSSTMTMTKLLTMNRQETEKVLAKTAKVLVAMKQGRQRPGTQKTPSSRGQKIPCHKAQTVERRRRRPTSRKSFRVPGAGESKSHTTLRSVSQLASSLPGWTPTVARSASFC